MFLLGTEHSLKYIDCISTTHINSIILINQYMHAKCVLYF